MNYNVAALHRNTIYHNLTLLSLSSTAVSTAAGFFQSAHVLGRKTDRSSARLL